MVSLICFGCGARGAVSRVTAGLQCRCGSRDIDLDDGSPQQKILLAHLQDQQQPGNYPTKAISTRSTLRFGDNPPEQGKSIEFPPGDRSSKIGRLSAFQEWMVNTHEPRSAAIMEGPQGTRAQPVGGDKPGWNEYAGPRPTPNPNSNGVATPLVCPTCRGTGFDLQDGQKCRECGGSGWFTPNTDAQAPAVARHDYPSNQTTVPFMGRKKARKSPSRQPVHQSDPLSTLLVTITRANPGLTENQKMALARKTLDYVHAGGDR